MSSKRFKSFVHSLDPQYQLPSHKHLSAVLLAKKYREIRAKVVNHLQNTPSINLTMDLWTNRQMRSFVGITGHFISHNWQMESVMLCCDRMTTRHTTENILQQFEDITHAFGVNEKVHHIITDTAANMKRAFASLPGYEDSPDETSESDSDSEDNSLEVDLVEISVTDILDLLPLNSGHRWIGCFAHVLHLRWLKKCWQN